jgi:hypothetical protein
MVGERHDMGKLTLNFCIIVLFSVLFVCECVLYCTVLYYCHRMSNQIAVNKYIISYHIISYHIILNAQ